MYTNVCQPISLDRIYMYYQTGNTLKLSLFLDCSVVSGRDRAATMTGTLRLNARSIDFRNFHVKRKTLGKSALVMREEKRQDLT